MRASPAGEMRRLGAIETTFWPRARAHRAFCEAEILARAAALIVRRPRVARVLFNPLSALIAVSSAFSCVLLCHVQSSTARLCPCVLLRARIVADAETARIWRSGQAPPRAN